MARRLYVHVRTAMTPEPLPMTITPPANDSPANPTVADVASTLVVKVPGWFTAGAALRVARLKGADHLLVVDRQQLIGSISADTLAAASPQVPLERLMTRTGATVTPETPLRDAHRLMARAGVGCLPVVSGALLLGVVSYRPTPLPSRAPLAAE
jgi:Mg/Co/Ni transporter MgtE